jgi:hypothetical protein
MEGNMAITEIDGGRQIQDLTLTRGKLKADFLEGSNLDLTDGNFNATISGLAAGALDNDAVNKAQMEAAINAAISGGMTYKGVIDASDATGATLDGAKTGDFYYVSVAGTLDGKAFSVGDHLVVNADITDFDVDGAGKIDIIDNTESSDILRDADIVDDIVTGGSDKVLSAEQGVVLKGLIDAEKKRLDERVFGEKPTVTDGSPILAALANIPVDNGTLRVYLNGLRMNEGAGNDYTVNYATGVITFEYNLKTPKDIVICDYEYTAP